MCVYLSMLLGIAEVNELMTVAFKDKSREVCWIGRFYFFTVKSDLEKRLRIHIYCNIYVAEGI